MGIHTKTQKFWKTIFSRIITDADVIFEVLDSRNPLGTRNYHLEDFVRKNAPEKEIYIILNKIDLIPKLVLDKWLLYFRKNTDFKIFYVSALYNRGIIFFKRQISSIFSKKNVKAMIVGYPNTGKSSLINALAKNRKKIGISSKAGFTRGVMTVKITSTFSLIDTPGVIPLSEDDELDQALKGIINPEKIQDKAFVAYKIIDVYLSPAKLLEFFGIDKEFIKNKMDTESADYFTKKFLMHNKKEKESGIGQKIGIKKISGIEKDIDLSLKYEDFEKIIFLVGNKRGILSHGGIVNENQVYITIIHAWQKNKIKYYVIPPES
ncbi:MAG: GTPase [Promethearchaeota archaeon]